MDERAAFEAIAHWKDMTPFAWFQQGWKAARRTTPDRDAIIEQLRDDFYQRLGHTVHRV